MPISLQDSTKAIRTAYEDATEALKVRPINSFLDVVSDAIVVTYPTGVQEVYTFKTGGTGGTTVRTITVTYTDSTKVNLSTVVKT